ncbi:F-box/WD repeat-containing protein 8 isoform X1 [Paramormyrops kingsleyae]|uniref:F-box/WD repeat-containing protein 8 isoform X1 n=1 Tax=Paramormyrops kingsleyae TaxID=1676925 RepID=UPI003B975BFB
MENEDLEAFLEHWKSELLYRPAERPGDVNGVDGNPNDGVREPGADGRSWLLLGDTRSDCASAAAGRQEGWVSPPRYETQATTSRRKRQRSSSAEEPPCRQPRNDALVQQLIEDLNEMNDIPFFDVDLPYELALKIFQYLNRTDLGRCAQVSKTWKVLAEDEVLWYRLCLKAGYHSGAGVNDSPCWKSTLRDCKKAEDTLRYNWKNRIGTISNLQYELGRVLCDVSSCDDLVIAGYTSGDIRLWDTLYWDSRTSYLRPSHVIAGDGPFSHVSQVKVNEVVAVAAYKDGLVNVWSTETGQEPVHLYQHLQKVQNVALGSEGAAVATASGPQVRVDGPLDGGCWTTLCQAELPKPVESLLLVPKRREAPLAVAAAGESVYLLGPEREPSLLHSVYGHPVTCLDVTPSHVALGVKRHGWAVSDGGNKIQVYSLLTGQSEVTVGNAVGDFTCINLRDAPDHLLVCGNKDQRVRVFDLRCGSSVASLYAHQLGVTTIQADDWKIVSGGGEGLVCVWEMRMRTKLWEMHNRHPVRHVRFGTSRLVTANIPEEKTPRGACITDDDLTAHRRHRGVVYLYDFSEDTAVPDHVLPICRSDYTEDAGYNYNISLAMPYDAIAGSRGAL